MASITCGYLLGRNTRAQAKYTLREMHLQHPTGLQVVPLLFPSTQYAGQNYRLCKDKLLMARYRVETIFLILFHSKQIEALLPTNLCKL